MADYIHRCGRTGRCGSPSENLITNFITRLKEVDLLNSIEVSIVFYYLHHLYVVVNIKGGQLFKTSL